MEDSRWQLLAELERIHRLGWITSKQLGGGGRLSPCEAPQCGGLTLEAELGITKAAADRIMRAIPTVEFEGLRKVYVKRSDVERLIRERTNYARTFSAEERAVRRGFMK